MKVKETSGRSLFTVIFLFLTGSAVGQQPGSLRSTGLPIKDLGTTYAMAQELEWLDNNYFVVGRWDGTLGIFKFNGASGTPILAHVINTPSGGGVQMITGLQHEAFVSSNDAGSILVWRAGAVDRNWDKVSLIQTLKYDTTYGVANSGAAYLSSEGKFIDLVVGHANGWVTFWVGTSSGDKFTFVKSVKVSGPKPVNPYGLVNVRGVRLVKVGMNDSYVVTGSEDGDLCIIRFPDGNILSRTVYNPLAKLGINNIATKDSLLLVANCSVGPTDKNLWYYVIHTDNWSIQLVNALNLKVDSSLKQVFNFDVIWANKGPNLYWISTTQEGYAWVGKIDGANGLATVGNAYLNEALGTPLAITNDGKLALAGQNVHEFILQ